MRKTKARILNFILAIIMLFSTALGGCQTNNLPDGFDIDNSFFTTASFTKRREVIEEGGGITSYEYYFIITSSCQEDISAFRAEVSIFDAYNNLLEKSFSEIDREVLAGQEFSFELPVSSDTYHDVLGVQVKFFGKKAEVSSPSNPPEGPQSCTVILVYNNGKSNSTVTVEKGKTIPTPSDPQKNNYIFSGWYTNSSLSVKYDFSQAVNSNLTLYAGYQLDALKITNEISTDTMKGVVKIYNKSYDTIIGITTSSSTSQGSGFCFHIQDGYYYVLTNCHVARKKSGYDKQKFTIEDYQGNTYEGYLYKNPNKTVSAIAASYDLACLYFKSSSTNVKKLSFVSDNPLVSSDLILLGAPSGQSNYINYGKVCSYSKVTLNDTPTSESNVQFDVIKHSAVREGGASGGPVLDANLNVIGVHYAGQKNGIYGYAIPVKKVREFLTDYVYN